MADPAPTTPLVDLRDLRLETAHALLAQAAGGAPRPGTVGGTAQGEQQAPARYLQGLIDGLCELSPQDPLTGLIKHQHLGALLEREIDRATRSGEAALLLRIALDGLHSVSATQGVPAGNALLQALARRLAACVRPMDSLARHGGAEFALVLPACPTAFGPVVAERLHRAVTVAAAAALAGQAQLPVTISIGGAFALPADRQSAQQWSERAGQQLARARAAGANHISIEELPGSAVSAEEKSLLFGPPPGNPPPAPAAAGAIH